MLLCRTDSKVKTSREVIHNYPSRHRTKLLCIMDKFEGFLVLEFILFLLNANELHAQISDPTYGGPDYDQCKNQKGVYCFPSEEAPCSKDKKCPYLVLWRFVPDTEYIEFKVIRPKLVDKSEADCNPSTDGTAHFVALGLSASGRYSGKKHESMAVIECSIDTKTKKKEVVFAWGSKTGYKRWEYVCDETTKTGKITHCQINHQKSLESPSAYSLICQFKLTTRLVLNHQIFNLDDSLHFIHLQSGCDRDKLKSFNEGEKYYTSEAVVRFHPKHKSTYDSFRSTNAKWHGSIMLVAWCVFVPNGMFVSRYFKESLVKFSLFKYRLWFAGHSMIMITAFLMTLAALGTIVEARAEVDFAWPTEASTLLHFYLGFAAVFMFIGQISIGWIRCHGRKIRRSFAALHLFIGTCAYTISLVCIGNSYRLGMPCNILFYAIVFGVWILLCHVAMTVHFYFLDKKLGLVIYRAFYPFPIPPVTYDELPGTKIRVAIFTTHLTGCIILAIVTIFQYLDDTEANKGDCRKGMHHIHY